MNVKIVNKPQRSDERKELIKASGKEDSGAIS